VTVGPIFAFFVRIQVFLGFISTLDAFEYISRIKKFSDVSFTPILPIKVTKWGEFFKGLGMSLWFPSEENATNIRKQIAPIFWFIFPAHALLWLLLINLITFFGTMMFIFENTFVLMISMTNSELIFHLFADKNHDPFITSLISIILEDFPQVVIQVVFALTVNELSSLQIFSFVFTFWRMGYTVALRIVNNCKKKVEEIDRVNPIASSSERFDFTLGIFAA
jgi:hypothetical protein